MHVLCQFKWSTSYPLHSLANSGPTTNKQTTKPTKANASPSNAISIATRHTQINYMITTTTKTKCDTKRNPVCFFFSFCHHHHHFLHTRTRKPKTNIYHNTQRPARHQLYISFSFSISICFFSVCLCFIYFFFLSLRLSVCVVSFFFTRFPLLLLACLSRV